MIGFCEKINMIALSEIECVFCNEKNKEKCSHWREANSNDYNKFHEEMLKSKTINEEEVQIII